jgi:hypothetical protein
VSSWTCFNVWQPLTDPREDAPLALCDASSVEEADVVCALGQLSKHKETEVEISLFRANRVHRWFYFSGMRPNEALVFTGFDPAVGGTQRTVARCAFDDPAWPGDVPPRGSVEVRAMVIFG